MDAQVDLEDLELHEGAAVLLRHALESLKAGQWLHTTAGPLRLEAGMSALVAPGEVHWFENDSPEEFSFLEFWAPPPTDTVWTVAGDRCTWAPAR